MPAMLEFGPGQSPRWGNQTIPRWLSYMRSSERSELRSNQIRRADAWPNARPGAYEGLEELLRVNLWRDNTRISALAGMEALQDNRVRGVALRYAARGHSPLVRAAAFRLLGRVGDEEGRPSSNSWLAAQPRCSKVRLDFAPIPAFDVEPAKVSA